MEIGKTNLFTIASDLRYFILTGLETLPLTIGGTFLIIGHFIGNYAMLFFLVGYLMFVPFAAFIINLFAGFAGKQFGWGGKDEDACNVITGFGTSAGVSREKNDMIVSYWMAMVGFFIGYMFTNAWSLYSKPSASGTDSDPKVAEGVTLRQSQSITAMVLILILAVALIYIRFWSSCDSWVSLILGGGFASIGWWWYTLLASIGEDRLSDLFGIANRLMTPSALINAPYACLPLASD